MDEIYKSLDIINCSRYLVSNQGNIFDTKYNMNMPLKHRTDNGGYVRVPLVADDGTHFSMAVHRLVMIAFDYREDYKALEVDHINCIKDDNRLENLRWTSHTENMNNPNTVDKLKGKQQKRNDYPELHEYRSKVAKACSEKRVASWKKSYEEFRNDPERFTSFCNTLAEKLGEAKLKRWEYEATLYDLDDTLIGNQKKIFEITGHKYSIHHLVDIRNFKNPNHIKNSHPLKSNHH